MTAALRRPPIWLVVLVTALLASVLTLSLDRTITALRSDTTPTPTIGPVQQFVVVVETPEPEPEPSAIPGDDTEAALRDMLQQQARYQGFTFVHKAIWQLAFASEALIANDGTRADRELDAARAALDEALRLLPEDLKPQIQNERLQIGRIRADLEIDPRGLDEELRRMRDRLLTLIAPQLPQ